MKLFVDDERNRPDDTWLVSRKPDEAIQTIKWAFSTHQSFEILSLDHDLGENIPTGYDIAAWLEKEVWTNGMIPPTTLKVHSANPVGKQRILQCFESIARFCEQNGMEVPKIEA